MAGEFSVPGVEYLPTGSRGVDMLWLEDPGAKALYSDNPGFTDGIEEAERAPVPEALRAIHIYNPPRHSPEGALGIEAIPLNHEVALTGLVWLLGNMDKDDPLRRAAAKTRAPLESKVAAEQYAEAQRATPEARYQAELDRTVAAFGEAVPETLEKNYRAVSGWTTQRIMRDTPGGRPAVEAGPLRAKIESRTAAYLANPAILLGDLKVIAGIGTAELAAGSSGSDSDTGPAYIFSLTAAFAIQQALAARSYRPKDFTPELVARWTRAAEALPANLRIPHSQLEEVKEMEAEEATDMIMAALSQAMAGATPEDSGAVSSQIVALGLSAGFQILTNSLRTIGRDRPREFIDAMYMVANAGLDPEHHIKRDLTAAALEACLTQEDERIPHIVNLSLAANDPEIRQKALDLRLTLVNLDVPTELFVPPPPGDGVRLIAGQFRDRAMRQMYPSVLYRPDLSPETAPHLPEELGALYKQAVREFWEYAKTPEGQSSTLYGRFLAANEAEERAAASGSS